MLGSPVRRDLFSVAGVGRVTGLELRDGRCVVVKVVRPDQPLARLWAMQEVQRLLVADGFPAPVPLAAPSPLGDGIAFVEQLRDVGEMPNGHLDEHRREMASQLHRLIGMCTKVTPNARARLGLGRPAWVDYTSGDPWPVSHHSDADFTATGEGSEVLDELARVSKSALCAAGETSSSVIGHADWEAQNLRFDNDRLEMVYDWDSLVVERESVIVGLASAVFPARSEPGLGDAPTAAEQDAFLTDYQQTAGRVFTPAEKTLAVAAASWITAYNARIQFSTWRRPPEEGAGAHLDNAPMMLDKLHRTISQR